jgi:hypothetical protein
MRHKEAEHGETPQHTIEAADRDSSGEPSYRTSEEGSRRTLSAPR